MKLPFNFDSVVVVTYKYMEDNNRLLFRQKIGNFFFYTIQTGYSINEVTIRGHVLEYLDYFIIVLPSHYEEQRDFWKEFYEIIGRAYETLIDKTNNISCIDEMMKRINKHGLIDEKTVILDYGCGAGLSQELGCSGEIVGYDFSNEMRRLARKRGMHVVDEKQLASLPDNYFDACFASYVFHMAIREDELDIMLKKLKENSIIIANFYKDLNVDIVNEFFEKRDYRILKVNEMSERYGSFYEYTKM